VTLLTQTREQILERCAPDLIRPLATVKRQAIESALILCQGNVTEAAKRLGISRAQLTRIVAQWRKEDS